MDSCLHRQQASTAMPKIILIKSLPRKPSNIFESPSWCLRGHKFQEQLMTIIFHRSSPPILILKIGQIRKMLAPLWTKMIKILTWSCLSSSWVISCSCPSSSSSVLLIWTTLWASRNVSDRSPWERAWNPDLVIYYRWISWLNILKWISFCD